jgi:hypothetical protein
MNDRHPTTIHASAPRGAGTRMTTGDQPQQERYEMGGWHSLPSAGMIEYVRADDPMALMAALHKAKG